MTVTFYADISEFQRTVDNTYPHPVLAARVDTGFRLDNHIAANWAHANASTQIQVFIGYVVFIPGQRAQILHRVKSVFGPTAPPKLVLMIDMESGQGFAGRGDHSTEANGLAQDFATYLGSTDRVVGYANHYDFQECWPTRPAWLKLVTASYGDQNPGTFAWQYYGGVPNPRPYGYPGSCPPFGTDVDLNAIQAPIADVVTSLGLEEDPLAGYTLNQISEAIWHAQITNPLTGKPVQAYQFLQSVNSQAFEALQKIAALQAELDAIKTKVGA